jgi:hypothetical protein
MRVNGSHTNNDLLLLCRISIGWSFATTKMLGVDDLFNFCLDIVGWLVNTTQTY